MTTSLVQSALESVPWTIRDVAKALLWALAISALGVVASLAAARLLVQSQTESAWVLAAAFGSEAALFGTSWYFGVHKYRSSWQKLGLRLFHWTALLVAAVVMVAGLIFNAVYVLVVINAGWQSLLPPPLPPIFARPGLVGILGAVLAAAVAPLAEEVFFRGLLFGALKDRCGVSVGATVSALLFAGAHFHAGVIIPIFFLGLLLAALYYRTQSVVPGVLVHTAYNGLALRFYDVLALGVSC